MVPTADIVAALGTKLGSVAPILSSVPNVSTCSYADGSLSISVGTTTIANPALPLKVVTVPGLPTGTYKTYKGSTQTEIVFFKGSAATGTYGVVRNFVKIKQAKLKTIAIALYKGISGPAAGGASTTHPSNSSADNTAASLPPYNSQHHGNGKPLGRRWPVCRSTSEADRARRLGAIELTHSPAARRGRSARDVITRRGAERWGRETMARHRSAWVATN